MNCQQNSNLFSTILESGEFVYTAELVLGRDHTATEAEQFVKNAAQFRGGIGFVSLTDLPGGNPALPPEAIAAYVIEHGLTPIAHLSGKDGNRNFLEARLHVLARIGVQNILALTGDAQREGFTGPAKPVHDLDSVLILRLVQSLREGLEFSLGAKTLRTTPFGFFAGAVVNPYKTRESDLMMQMYKLRLKIAAGARFIIPQLGFNLRKLYELKQYMQREGLGHIPVLANVYVPTAKIARMMQAGEVAGCLVSDELIRRLQGEKKPQRLERAALMVAAVKDLGFAGAHIGGFGLVHQDFMSIIERAEAIGKHWRERIDELTFPLANEFYLFPPSADGLSDCNAAYQRSSVTKRPSLAQRLSSVAHRNFIQNGSFASWFFSQRLKPEDHPLRSKLWEAVLAPSTIYRQATLGCESCGDCIQDHLNYAGCTMHACYKELRNGPCGGSRVDGTCEARADQPCIWNEIYLTACTMGDDPEKFARTLIPPRDWALDGSNALVNRFAGLDNFHKRTELGNNERRTHTHADNR